MAKTASGGSRRVRAALLGPLLGVTAISTLGLSLGLGEAYAKVGVTSATDGDPLGKPPQQNERILRIGIDVQANELITTRANDRAHLVFLDGTSLTVGPNAQLTIDRFVFDPASSTGELAVNATRGVFRLVGGKISKAKPITVTTPSSTIGIRGGIMLGEVQPTSTKATFVFGTRMTVTANGSTQTVLRPGFQIITSLGGTPGQPTKANAASYSSQLTQLEGNVGQGPGGGPGSGPPPYGGVNPDQIAQTSGFASQNSGKPGGTYAQPPVTNNFGTGPGPTNRNPNNTISTALANANTDQQFTQGLQQAGTLQQSGSGPQIPNPPGPVTTVIVTRGKFAQEPRFTNFNNSTLGVTPVAQNNVLLQPTGTRTNGTATFNLADNRSFSVPWQPSEAPYAISFTHPDLGLLNGTGFVSQTGDFFAFVFTDAAGTRMGFVGGTPTTMAQFPTQGFATHVLSSLESNGRLPFSNLAVGNDPALRGAASVSPLYSAYSTQTTGAIGSPAPGPQRAMSMQSTVSIAGQGASQKSYMGVFIGDYFRDYNNNTAFNSGTFQSTYRMDGSQPIGRQVSSESTFDTGGGNSIYGNNAQTMVFTNDGARSNIETSQGLISKGTTSRTPQASFDQPYTNLNGTPYIVDTVATRTPTAGSVGQTRTDRQLTGFVGGIAEGMSPNGNISSRQFGGEIALQTSATNNRAAATITINQWDGTSTSATFQLGGTSGQTFATSAFIDDRTYALRDRSPDLFATQTTSVTSHGITSSGTDVQSRTAMVSYNAAPTPEFFAAQGVTPCTCDFMTWGWWGGDVRYNPGSSYNPNGRDRLNLATYVAGTVTPVAQLNQMTGSASYTGHLVGSVQNGVNSYQAAGSYTNQWNFGSRTGIATVNFDGASFGGGITPNTIGSISNSNFQTIAPMAATNGGLAAGRSLNLNGSFTSSASTVAAGQMGNFSITGPNYQAGGSFAAQK
ncbi:MAG: FecR domain-containing protein [Reyranella sp.]|uniref:FecR domain-containing protein n=1 Tax=Reyranella sp. TaxID=1929291 RepID=UPI003D0C397F